jgi:2-keto-4-pentenoate hydratase/2-oxohepta-3-ene-1,7-dioic acid hydratase in catechol pathway
MKFIRRAETGANGPREQWYQQVAEGFVAWSCAPYAGSATAPARAIGAALAALPAGRTLAPATPSKIVCVGRNYAAHAKELGNPMPSEPMLFLKPPSAVIAAEEYVEIPAASQRVEHEAELAVVIGKRMHNVPENAALTFVAGYTCGFDITARDLQKKDVQFTRGKGFDTFCPLGPELVVDLDPLALDVTCTVNGVLRQHGNTREMAFPVAMVLSYISHIMTLEPGDVVLTGTPEGVGPLTDGDTVEMHIAGIAPLRVQVRNAARLPSSAT